MPGNGPWWGRRGGRRGGIAREEDDDDDQVELTAVGNREVERGAEEGPETGRGDRDDDANSSSRAPSPTGGGGDDGFAAEGALAGTDWQVRLGGLIFATTGMVSSAAASPAAPSLPA